MTGLPARGFGIPRRGGGWPWATMPTSASSIPGQRSTARVSRHRRNPAAGIWLVLVNGVAVWRGGQAVRPAPVVRRAA
jgi:hypothetical protein